MERTIVSSFVPAAAEGSQETRIERQKSQTSGVSWGAIIAGAVVTAALWLGLMALGTGIGLSAMSPWSSGTSNATRIGLIAIIWMILSQIIASGMGGYLAGRLRTRWVNVHTDEVHFRDTAHGFLVWAVSLVATAAFLASAAAAMAGGTASIANSPAMSNSTGAENSIGPYDYFIDTMLRGDRAAPDASRAVLHNEALGVFAHSMAKGTLTAADKSYLGGLVAARTGISPIEAEQRVGLAYAEIQQAADTARKATAHALYWTFLALLVGAFCASIAATIGGRQRDQAV